MVDIATRSSSCVKFDNLLSFLMVSSVTGSLA